MSDNSKITYKIIIIGDSAVGKTCIFKKITSNTFNEKSISTIGMDRRTLFFTIKDSKGSDLEIEVQLWDTAGQERFRSITATYYKSSQGLLLMYDITKRETFSNVENWIENVNDSLGNNNDYLIVLMGNKLDLVKNNPEARDVSEEEAQKICQDKNIYWGGECSAKDFSEEELKNIFTKYTQEIYKKVGVNIVKGEMVTPNNNDNKKKKSFC
jgi:small GTP-binding protein